MKSVVVYGGGNIAHSLSAVISAHQPVTVVTRRPEYWGDKVAWSRNGIVESGKHGVSSTSDVGAVADADIVFVALPQFAVEEALANMRSLLKLSSTVAFVPAPAKTEQYARALSEIGVNTVGFQRVPYVSRIIKYGQAVQISKPRAVHKLAVSNFKLRKEWSQMCVRWFGGKAEYLASFLTFAFSNSNPLLHPSRLKILLAGGDCGRYRRCPRFYAEWTDESSELYVLADREMKEVFASYAPEVVDSDYESVLEHYGVSSPVELTKKIRSIDSFKSILAPWKLSDGGLWCPDYESRYFTEDIPYGTRTIQQYARRRNISTPIIDELVKIPSPVFL